MVLEKLGLPPKPSARGHSWTTDAANCEGCSSTFSLFNRKVPDLTLSLSLSHIFFLSSRLSPFYILLSLVWNLGTWVGG